MLRGSFGSYLLAGGAVGEFFPIVAIAIFLGSNGRFLGLMSLLAVAVIALVLSLIPRLGRGGRLAQILTEGQNATAQTTLPWTVVMLLLLLLIANTFGLDAVLGAFLAGVVLRRWAPGDVHSLEEKLDAVGYGFFIPIFFVTSGMSLDLHSIVQAPGRLLLFFVLLLCCPRTADTAGISALPRPQRFELVFLLATALPLLVALSEIGLQSGNHAAAKCGCFGWSRCAFGAGLSGSRRWHRPACCPIS
jgi:Kef-type K+ transport system membrane component KefB